MRKLIVIAGLLLSGTAFASEPTIDSVVGTTLAEVQTSLTAMGYEVRKLEMEDGKIEAYVVRDRSMGEIYVDTKTGKITKLKMK